MSFFGRLSADVINYGGVTGRAVATTTPLRTATPAVAAYVAPAIAAAARAAAERQAAELLKQMSAIVVGQNGNKLLASAEFEKNKANNQLTAAQWGEFAKWMSDQRSLAEGQLSKLRVMNDDVQQKAATFTSLAATAGQARTVLATAEANIGRFLELEKWSIELFDAVQARGNGLVTSAAVAAMAPPGGFPTWGYVVGGALIIGGALFLSRK